MNGRAVRERCGHRGDLCSQARDVFLANSRGPHELCLGILLVYPVRKKALICPSVPQSEEGRSHNSAGRKRYFNRRMQNPKVFVCTVQYTTWDPALEPSKTTGCSLR
jgi:hypothetical protein